LGHAAECLNELRPQTPRERPTCLFALLGSSRTRLLAALRDAVRQGGTDRRRDARGDLLPKLLSDPLANSVRDRRRHRRTESPTSGVTRILARTRRCRNQGTLEAVVDPLCVGDDIDLD
jgi:hypothetical protein